MEWTDEKDLLIIESSFRDLTDYITQFLPHVCMDSVKRAFNFANMAHYGQKRHSGEPYITHPLEVAKVLAELRLDTSTIICALMHDVVEDTPYTLKDIEDRFSKTEAVIIDGLTRIQSLENQNISFNKVENFRRLIMAVANDVRVLLIKLADRLHNMRTLSSINNHRKRLRIAKETIDIYAPLAERIGIHFFKNLLYDMAFEVLYPHVRQSIIVEIDNLRTSGLYNINEIIDNIGSLLKKEGVMHDIHGREKSAFSIWQKMEKKHIHFDQLSDVFAIRIITEKALDCYRILGVIHINFKVISSEFIDYISTPKNNGYQSIHTVIFVDESIRVEIQIRTKEMHQVSELGMAAHWIYKNDSRNNEYHQEWLGRIRTILESINDTNDVITNVKLEMYVDEVFCFTPVGDVVVLPRNSTPLDFAFEVSVELGSHYSKAIVNGYPVSISTHLQSGDQVEILTSDQIMINHHWLDIVRTPKAKNEIEVHLNKRSFDALVLAGNLTIHDECEKQGLALSSNKLEKVASAFKTSIADLLFKIGNGDLKMEQVLNKLSNDSIYSKIQHYIRRYIFRDIKNKSFKTLGSLRKIAEIHFTYCCDPLSEKTAIGLWNKKHNFIVIHSNLCHNMRAAVEDEELCNIIIPDTSDLNLDVSLEIVMTEDGDPELIFNAITEFGLSKYAIDINKMEDGLIFLKIDLKLVVHQQLEPLINKIKRMTSVIDVVIS